MKRASERFFRYRRVTKLGHLPSRQNSENKNKNKKKEGVVGDAVIIEARQGSL